MTTPRLLNPSGKLLAEIEPLLFLALKTKPLWAKQVAEPQEIVSLEGREQVAAGDYVCRGIHGELWPQKLKKLQEKYVASDQFTDDGWQRFDPKPAADPVQAAQISTAFRVQAHWGELTGKPNDYIVRSTTDLTDIWIVDKAIFEASYETCKQSFS